MSNISEHLARYKVRCKECMSEVDDKGQPVAEGTAHDLFFIGAFDAMGAHFDIFGHNPEPPIPTKEVGRESPIL